MIRRMNTEIIKKFAAIRKDWIHIDARSTPLDVIGVVNEQKIIDKRLAYAEKLMGKAKE